LRVALVVKVGGSLLGAADRLDSVLAEIAIAGRDVPLLVVPGGGPFANAVRDADRLMGLGDDTAHWMAILAMEQYAHVITSRLPGSVLVTRPDEGGRALVRGQIPVLAPYVWLRDADPLPHSWDVTSDSISAWVAGQVGASRLVLVKPAGASGPALMDPCFERFLPPHIVADIVTADRIDELRATLRRV
jgi:aspartokinase-like uncharacterized kinase